MTMILFSVIKKDAATVTEKDPLELDITEPLPENCVLMNKISSSFQRKKQISRKKNLQEDGC